MPATRKILVAMSGGVDSSVAAAVLRERGHEVVGAFMRTGVENGDFGLPISDCGLNGAPSQSSGIQDPRSKIQNRTCCSIADAADARRVADRLGIPFYVLNFAEQFDSLIDYFVGEYNRGRTPNPCVLCNSRLKFGRLFEYADSIGADAVATGHYARIVATAGGPALARGADPGKDQSYVLFATPPAMLGRIVLPLGEWTKERVRAKAAELGLPVAAKPDSQEICFVPDGRYAAVIERAAGGSIRPGLVRDQGGRVVGWHRGHQHYTIGQRRGLGISMGEPVYVTAIDAASNTLTVGSADALLRRELTCAEVNWLLFPCPSGRGGGGEGAPPGDFGFRISDFGLKKSDCELARFRAHVQIRYNAPAAAANVFVLAPNRARVVFDSPVSAVAPGQAAVFYDDAGVVLGGGWID